MTPHQHDSEALPLEREQHNVDQVWRTTLFFRAADNNCPCQSIRQVIIIRVTLELARPGRLDREKKSSDLLRVSKRFPQLCNTAPRAAKKIAQDPKIV